MAAGPAKADATEFEVTAARGDEDYGILSNPFLDDAFRTLSFRMRVTTNPDGTWSYEEEAVLQLPGLEQPFPHTDRNTLTRVRAPEPNPLAAPPTVDDQSLGVGSLRPPTG